MYKTDFPATYREMTEAEIKKLGRGRRALVPEARTALEAELANRGISLESLKPRKRKPRPKRTPEEKEEIRRQHRGRILWALGAFAAMILAMIFLEHYGELELFMPVVITWIVISATIGAHWRLRRYRWFWVLIGIVLIAHVAVTALMPPEWQPLFEKKSSVKGIAMLDLVAIYSLIWVLEKLLRINPKTGEPCRP